MLTDGSFSGITPWAPTTASMPPGKPSEEHRRGCSRTDECTEVVKKVSVLSTSMLIASDGTGRHVQLIVLATLRWDNLAEQHPGASPNQSRFLIQAFTGPS